MRLRKSFNDRELSDSALGLEAARRAHKLEQILDAGFAAFGLLALVVIEEAARLQHVIHLLKERQILHLARHALDECHEAVHCGGCLRPECIAHARRRRLPQGGTGGCFCLRAYDIQTLRADAARRQVHHPLEGGVVAAIGDEPEVRERILDFRTLEESQAAVHAIRHACRQQGLLQHARLRIRSV